MAIPQTPDEPRRRSKKAAQPRRCSLRLMIAGVEYRVRPVEVGGSPRAFTLTRDGATPYTISATASGVVCSCEAFAYRKAGTLCKHTLAARACGLI